MVLLAHKDLQVLTVPMAQPDLLVRKGLQALVVEQQGQQDLRVLTA
jgi:hypothetical protein